MQVDVRTVWRVSLDRVHGMHRTLGALAEKCHAFAKALHYKEVEFAQTPETAVESLISINNQLRQPEAAIGILAVAQNDLHMELKVCAPNTTCSGK
jgi:phosphatidylinositol kinase/protein kinase (PI-3  family)